MNDVLEQMPGPSFPVYGLADAYPDSRWMNVWNRLWSPDGPVWMIVLGHGDPDSDEHIGVVTDGKLAQHPTTYGSVGPTGVDDVRRMVMLEMVTTPTPAAERDSASFRRALQAARSTPPGFDTSATPIEVDGVRVPFTFLRHRQAWAGYADLGQSAVGMFGAKVGPQDVALQTVNARLADYGQIS